MGCVSHVLNSGTETLFWKDGWLNGRAPMYYWPNDFMCSCCFNGTVRELEYLLAESPFIEVEGVLPIRDRVRVSTMDSGDKKGWRLTSNGTFFGQVFLWLPKSWRPSLSDCEFFLAKFVSEENQYLQLVGLA